MDNEMKKILDELQGAFTAFKAANDERLRQIEAKGSAGAELEEKVNRANAAITAAQTKLDELAKAQKEQETLVARLEALGRRSPDEAARVEATHALAFHGIMAARHGRPAPVAIGEPELASYRAYRQAFARYVRRGEDVLERDVRAALTTGSDPEGGYGVPPDLTGRIIQFLRETSPIREFAAVDTTSRKEKTGKLDLGEAGAGWTNEVGSGIGETAAPTLGAWKIPVHDMYAEPKATQDELDDADFDIEAWLVRNIGMKLARLEANAFVVGTGIAKPRGFLTYASGTPTATTFNVIEQTKTGVNGGFHATLPGDVFLTAIGLLKAAFRARARWAMNRTTEAAVRKIKDGQSNYLWQPSFQAGVPSLLAGHPVSLFEDMPAIATGSLSIALADFLEAYQIVDRRGMTVLRDPYTAKPYVKFYTTRRVGGDVVNFEAVKLIDFSA